MKKLEQPALGTIPLSSSKKASGRIFGISLGSRKLGIAVLDRCSIFDCAVKSFPGKWSETKRQAILAVIERYVIDYRIERVAIKLPALPLPSPALVELLAGIQALAHSNEFGFSACTLDELKSAWNPRDRMNKKQFMLCVAEKYPELRQEYERAMKSRAKHYEMMFEAVGVVR